MAESVIKFGTDGWRAIMNDTFILSNVRIVAQAIADYIKAEDLGEKGIVIGYDTRFFAERFAQECASIMVGNGVPVFMPRRALPTPLTAFSIKVYGAAGAIMLTASHNPPEYNGIKFIPEYAGPASPEITGKIEGFIAQIIASGRILQAPIEGASLVRDIDPYTEYVKQISSLIDFDRLRQKKLRIILDPMFGAGQGLMDKVLVQAGCAVDTIHNFRDTLFGGSYPDPSEKHLTELRDRVLNSEADLGLALDGDADRFGAIDHDGTYITANQVLSLVAVHLLKNRGVKGCLVRTVATTHLLDEIARDYGTEVVETPVGFKYIAQVMMERPVVVGGEESGGLSILGHIPEKDGLLADLLLAEMVAYEEKSLSDILAEIYGKYGRFYTTRLDLHLAADKKDEVLKSLRDNPPADISGDKVAEVRTVDGIKLVLESGDWLLARPSGTEPLVRIYIESRDTARFSALESYASKVIAS
ncbi:MAG TPA: phosphoglucomutase [Actinobacteria bacterium]|nr:phosphoglucomutase [Actinomycetota bacterium]